MMKSNFMDKINNYNYVDSVIESLKDSNLPLIIWGGGIAAEHIYKILEKNGVDVDYIAVNKAYWKPNQKLFQKPVFAFEDLMNENIKVNVLIAFSAYTEEGYKKFLKEDVVENIYKFDFLECAFEKPDIDYVKQNCVAFENLYNSLEDAVSKETLIAYVNQCITKDLKFLEPLKCEEQYFLPELKLGYQSETFLDCGAYDGDTILKFVQHIGEGDTPCGCEHIYAIECDNLNFDKLKSVENELGLFKNKVKQVTLLNTGLWCEKGKLSFNNRGSISSKIDSDGELTIEVDTIDNLVNGASVTFIKMDIEGAELNALKGAEKTIKKYRPRLAICVYHKKDDLLNMFRYIKTLHEDYKLCLRAHSIFTEELVLYAF